MTTALRINSEVDRSYCVDELKAFAPLYLEEQTETLPVDATVFVDGIKVDVLPNLPGLHAVQREYVGVWDAELILDGDFPLRWRTDMPLVSEAEVPNRRRGPTGLKVVGAAGVGVFTAVAIGTFVAGKSALNDGAESQYKSMRAANFGSGALAVGSGLVLGLGWVIPTRRNSES